MALFKGEKIFWTGFVLALAFYLTYALVTGLNEAQFMPGTTTHGHYQIELACSACHTKGMGVKQESCNACHEEELRRVDDSHPVIKFKDPRNAARLERLDARYCVTCHREHQPELTHEMGLSLPKDYCWNCHQTIGEERPTHKGLTYDSCATAGCHNFHDNTGLYERFLAEHMDEPDFKKSSGVPVCDFYAAHSGERNPPLAQEAADMPEEVEFTHRILHDWATTAHAAAGVNCTDCHEAPDPESGTLVWVDQPDHTSCQECHKLEVKGFLEGRHGMRLAQGMTPLTPGMARLPMKSEASHAELSCVSCHRSHRFNRRFAAVEACLQCHDDPHSRAYKESPHYRTFLKAENGEIPLERGVGCATCHLPRIGHSEFGQTFIVVDHNQNNTLRPNDKMIRPVCNNCHGLQWTLNALADEKLIESNFRGEPSVHVESLDMVREEQDRTRSN